LSYKLDVVKAVNMLEKGRLIVETKVSTHKQKKINHPTPLGLEFQRFMRKVEEFNVAFDRFENSRKQNFGVEILEKNPRILKSRGWTEAEVDLRKETFVGVHIMRDILERNIFNALICRYALLMADIGDNDIAKGILTKIVSDELVHQLFTIQQYYMPEREIMETLPGTLASGIVTEIAEFYNDPHYFLNNHHIDKQAREVIMSLLSIPEQFVKKLLKDQIPSMKVSMRLKEVKPPLKKLSKSKLIKNRGHWELYQIFKSFQQLS